MVLRLREDEDEEAISRAEKPERVFEFVFAGLNSRRPRVSMLGRLISR